MADKVTPDIANSVRSALSGLQDVVCEAAATANSVAGATLALHAHCSIGTAGGVMLTSPSLFIAPPHVSFPFVAAGGVTGCLAGVGYGYRSGNIQQVGKELYLNARKTCMSR